MRTLGQPVAVQVPTIKIPEALAEVPGSISIKEILITSEAVLLVVGVADQTVPLKFVLMTVLVVPGPHPGPPIAVQFRFVFSVPVP